MDDARTLILVAMKTVTVQDGERVLVMNAGNGALGLAIAAQYRQSQFLLHDSRLGMLRDSHTTSPGKQSAHGNVHVISEEELDQLRQADNAVDVIILQLHGFSALDLIRYQITQGYLCLREGGRFYLLSHKKTGGARHEALLTEIFGEDAQIESRGKKGYRIVEAIKGPGEQSKADFDIRRKVAFEILGQVFHLESEVSLFSKDDLDVGTRILLENVDLTSFERLLDVGCGWGAIGIVAARVNERGHVIMVDVDSRAVRVASDNVHRLNLQDRVSAIATDDIELIEGDFDLILSNPPFHSDRDALAGLFKKVASKTRKRGFLYIVVERTYLTKFLKILEQTYGNTKIHFEDVKSGFAILVSRN